MKGAAALGHGRWWAGLAAMFAVVALLVLPGRATVAAEGSHWTAPMRLGVDRPGVPMSVSCPAPRTCRAVDSHGNASTYDGRGWSPVHGIDRRWGPFMSISCPDDDFCAAVGGRRAVVRTAAGWGALRILDVPRMFAVSCASRRFCLALGETGLALRYVDGRWADRRMSAPAHARALSCSSRTFCLALTEQGGAFRYDGHGWRRAGSVPAGANPASVACLSRTLCVAATGTGVVARYHGRQRWTTRRLGQGFVPDSVACAVGPRCLAVATAAGQAATYDGRWHGPRVFHDYDEGPTPRTPDRVSCGGAGRCLVLDELGNTFRLAGAWHDGASYSAERNVAPVASCASGPRLCLVADGLGHAWGLAQGRWRSAGLPSPSGLSGTDPYVALSCGAGRCHLIDSRARAIAYDGAGWSAPVQLPAGRWANLACAGDSCVAVDATGETTSAVQVRTVGGWTVGDAVPSGLIGALDCTSSGDCWAGNAHGGANGGDGTDGWPLQHALVTSTDGDGLNRLSSMSCPTDDWCAVHDQYGATYVADHGTWSDPIPSPRLGAMDCPDALYCVAADLRRPGAVRVFDGDRWGPAERFMPAGYSGTVTSLTCWARTSCVAVDSNGNAFVRR